MIHSVLTFIWKNLVCYIIKRCTGEFMDDMFDFMLKHLVAATKSKADDEFYEIWKKKRTGA